MHAMVDRTRLLDRLHRPESSRVTIIIAPAGYGKTTLAEQWARTVSHPVIRIAVSPSRASATDLVEDIAGALGETPAAAPHAKSHAACVSDVIAAMNAIVAEHGALTLILDDFEQVIAPEALATVDTVIAGMPAGAHLMVLSRSTPGLTLARLRAIGRVRTFTADDLRFTLDEAIVALDGVSLTQAQVRRVVECTEGWITGIRLAREAIARTGSAVQIDDVLDMLARDHWLVQYFREEVLDNLPGPLRELVLLTSAFPTLEPELCAATLGIDNAEHSLQALLLDGAFVTRVEPFDSTLRYHRMFAEAATGIARTELGSARVREVWSRAARYLSDRGRDGEALELAVKSEDWEVAVDCAVRFVRTVEDREWFGVTLERLNLIPWHVLTDHDELAFAYIRASHFSGNQGACRTMLDEMLPRWSNSGDPVLRRYAATAETITLGFDGDTEAALEKCREVLALDPPGSVFDRLHMWFVAFHLEFLRGDADASERAYLEAARCQAELGRPSCLWDVAVRPERASQAAMRGDLYTAERMYRDQLLHADDVCGVPKGKLHMRLALIYLEWNHLDRALDAIGRIDNDHSGFPYQNWRPEALIAASRVYQASGLHQQAEQALRDAISLLEERGGAMHMHRAQALRAARWLESGQRERAWNWAAIHRHDRPDPVRQFGDIDPGITLIRVLLDEGAWREAAEIARNGVETSHDAPRLSYLVWRAVALRMGGETTAADAALRDALAIGVRGGFARAFQPQGYDLRDALARARQSVQPALQAYIDRLLGESSPASPPVPREVVVVNDRVEREAFDLTPREREVLPLMQLGYTNRQIAGHLYITERTAKKHIANICRKLAAPNRTAAVARAHEAGLLG